MMGQKLIFLIYHGAPLQNSPLDELEFQ